MTGSDQTSLNRMRLLVGVVMLCTCGFSVLQQIRGIIYWREGFARFTERQTLGLKDTIGGRFVQVTDTFPRLDNPSSELKVTGEVHVFVDRVELMPPLVAQISLGKSDLSRYWKFVSILQVKDNTTGVWALYIGRRSADASDGAGTIEVAQLASDGALSIKRISPMERSQSFAVFRLFNSLTERRLEPYAFAVWTFLPLDALAYVAPWVGAVISGWFVLSSWRPKLRSPRSPPVA